MRIGTGYDVHQLAEGVDLIIGGVKIPYDRGLVGHSDADVLLHAIMDALLGAAALGDIGRHFPDTDERYRGADSLKLLEEVGNMLADKGYLVNNIDATVIAQEPKLSPYMDQMIRNVASVLGIAEDQVNIKATSEEHLGFTGRKEGISAQAVCTILDYMDGSISAADSEGGCASCSRGWEDKGAVKSLHEAFHPKED